MSGQNQENFRLREVLNRNTTLLSDRRRGRLGDMVFDIGVTLYNPNILCH